MLAFLTSAAAQIIGGASAVLIAVGIIFWLGRREGTNSTNAKAARQDEATQATVIQREHDMAQAQADAPRDAAGVTKRLDEGTF